MKNFAWIERFLNNEMSSSEKEAFETEISKNEALATEVALQQSENEALDNLGFDILKNDIVAAAKKEKANKNTISKKENSAALTAKQNILRPLLIAASIAMLLFVSYMFLKEIKANKSEHVEQPISPEQKVPAIKEKSFDVPEPNKEIVEQKSNSTKEESKSRLGDVASKSDRYKAIAFAATPSNFENNMRGDGSEVEDLEWKQLLIKFDGEEFEEVIALVNEMKSSHPFYKDAIQLKAESLFYLSDFKLAQVLYLELLKNGDKFLKDNYEFELLRCYVAQLPIQKLAFKTLHGKILANPDHTYYKDIQSLLKEVRKVDQR